MTRAAPLALSLCLLLASCAPATVQTAGGPQTITVLGGVGYSLSNRVALENLTPETPDDAAITFTACQGGAIRAADVRRFGAEVALKACQQAIQRSTDAQTGFQTVSLILAPVVVVGTYFIFKALSCVFSFGSAGVCK